jgi:hypothetical protein
VTGQARKDWEKGAGAGLGGRVTGQAKKTGKREAGRAGRRDGSGEEDGKRESVAGWVCVRKNWETDWEKGVGAGWWNGWGSAEIVGFEIKFTL